MRAGKGSLGHSFEERLGESRTDGSTSAAESSSHFRWLGGEPGESKNVGALCRMAWSNIMVYESMLVIVLTREQNPPLTGLVLGACNNFGKK